MITDRIDIQIEKPRTSLTELSLPDRSKSWAGNALAANLTNFEGQKLPQSKLPEHRLKKKTHHGETNEFVWAKTDMTGWRLTMEDADSCVPSLPEPLSEWSFFAIFDGHGGDETAIKASEKLLPLFLEQPEIESITNSLVYETEKVEKALSNSFIQLDAHLQHMFRKNRRWSGSTCTATLITPTHIFTANLGDSRTLLVQKVFNTSFGTIHEDKEIDPGVRFSTSDHKPTDEMETSRISSAGLKVRDGRVQGNLAVSRAFGDFQYKKAENLGQIEQPVSCLPDVHCIDRSRDDEYIVLACDGIYDVLSNDELVVLLRAQFALKEKIEETAEEILDICLNRGSIDNMTMILIAFENVFDEESKIGDDIAEEDENRISLVVPSLSTTP